MSDMLVIGEMNILQIRSWDSTYRFAGSLVSETIRPFRHPPKKGFYLLHFPRARLFTSHIYVCLYL